MTRITTLRANRALRSSCKREDFNRAVELLAEHGRVRLVQIGKRRRLAVNPALLDGVVAIGSDDHHLDECWK